MDARQYDVALKDLRKAVDLDDDNSDAFNALGVLHERLGDNTEAETCFRKAISLKGDNLAAHNNYGRFLCARGRTQEAFREFGLVIGTMLYPQPWIPLTNAGLCAYASHQNQEAERYLRGAIGQKPDFAPALLGLARLGRDNRQFMAAQAFLNRYTGIVGQTPESLLLAMEIESGLGNLRAVADRLDEIQARFPDSREMIEARQRFGH